MENKSVKELFEKYCQKESDNSYFCDLSGHTYHIIPAAAEEIEAFRKNCDVLNVPENIKEELSAYFRQNNNFFNYFTCDDPAIFEWWEEHHELWLGCVNDDIFRYCSDRNKYTIGDIGDVSYGDKYEFDTLYDMLASHLKGRNI